MHNTACRFASVATRGPYSKLLEQDLDLFRSILVGLRSKIVVATDPSHLEKYNADWMRQVKGSSTAALFPTSAAEVSRILKHCHERHLAVCPQGGNTGLVYGSNPVHDEVIISLENMTKCLSINKGTMSATADSGVVLEVLQNAAKDEGLLVPLDMGSKGSCTIGGNVSTSAGGIHFARYGSMRSNVLGLEVVTAQGEILDLMSSLRKDNVGYDLKQLFIGSEGTLGIVTQVELKLFTHPKSINLALLLVKDFAAVLNVFRVANGTLAESLSAFEVMDADSIAHCGFPFPAIDKANYGVFVETHGSSEVHNFEKLESFVSACDDEGIPVLEQLLSTSESQTKTLWKVREELPVKLAQAGKIYKFDLSFPLDQFDISVTETRRILHDIHHLLPEEVLVVGYGHFGDGNVHLNIIDKTRKHHDVITAALYPAIYEFAARRKGSVSAEHGIGLMKKDYVPLSRSQPAMKLMHQMKALMDPKGILNPYKVL